MRIQITTARLSLKANLGQNDRVRLQAGKRSGAERVRLSASAHGESVRRVNTPIKNPGIFPGVLIDLFAGCGERSEPLKLALYLLDNIVPTDRMQKINVLHA